MYDATAFGLLLIVTGGLSLAFAAMAILADHVFPAIARHGWRRRVAAKYRHSFSYFEEQRSIASQQKVKPCKTQH